MPLKIQGHFYLLGVEESSLSRLPWKQEHAGAKPALQTNHIIMGNI